MSVPARPKRHLGNAVAIAILGALAAWLGALVGSNSLDAVGGSLSSCQLPASTAVTQVIDFPNNQPASAVQSTLTVTLPSSDPYATVLAGRTSSEKERSTDYQCLFGYPLTMPVKVTQQGQSTSFAVETDYLAPGILQPPTVTSDGLEFGAPIHLTDSGFSPYPAGTKMTLEVNTHGRQIMYSQPPLMRANGTLTWKWTLEPNPHLNEYPPPPPYDPEYGVLAWYPVLITRNQMSPYPEALHVTVPLGVGERITALLHVNIQVLQLQVYGSE